MVSPTWFPLMHSSDTIQLLARWRAGQDEAAAQLFDRYAGRLVGLARQRLSAKIGARVDAGDIVQSAYCTFFVGARDGRYVVEHSGDLWRLLVAITLHKLRRQLQVHTAAKRSVHREEALPAEAPAGPADPALLAREPTPEEAASLVATLEELLRPLQPGQRQVVELKLQGHSVGEIAAATGFSGSTVRRILERVQDQLAQADDLG